MKHKKNNFLLENNINKNYLKNNLSLKYKSKLKKEIKDIYKNLDNRKDTFHILSKKFILDLDKLSLKKFTRHKSIILIGMGGSALGSKAIYSFLNKKIKKNFLFLDNLDQSEIEKIKKKKI